MRATRCLESTRHPDHCGPSVRGPTRFSRVPRERVMRSAFCPARSIRSPAGESAGFRRGGPRCSHMRPTRSRVPAREPLNTARASSPLPLPSAFLIRGCGPGNGRITARRGLPGCPAGHDSRVPGLVWPRCLCVSHPGLGTRQRSHYGASPFGFAPAVRFTARRARLDAAPALDSRSALSKVVAFG